mmetsp:Transcript_64264/g.73784  ORF Transcript_64264/g.73784 Transcript_64264/m.73784 type:complete len:445 (-) Transcript_64264:149-1483(-)
MGFFQKKKEDTTNNNMRGGGLHQVGYNPNLGAKEVFDREEKKVKPKVDRQKGHPGGGWEDSDDEVEIKRPQATSNKKLFGIDKQRNGQESKLRMETATRNIRKTSAHTGNEKIGRAIHDNADRYEKALVADICQPGGLAGKPTEAALVEFCGHCKTLKTVVIGNLLIGEANKSNLVIQSKALHTMSYLSEHLNGYHNFLRNSHEQWTSLPNCESNQIKNLISSLKRDLELESDEVVSQKTTEKSHDLLEEASFVPVEVKSESPKNSDKDAFGLGLSEGSATTSEQKLDAFDFMSKSVTKTETQGTDLMQKIRSGYQEDPVSSTSSTNWTGNGFPGMTGQMPQANVGYMNPVQLQMQIQYMQRLQQMQMANLRASQSQGYGNGGYLNTNVHAPLTVDMVRELEPLSSAGKQEWIQSGHGHAQEDQIQTDEKQPDEFDFVQNMMKT